MKKRVVGIVSYMKNEKYKCFLIFIFFAVVLFTSWCSDDAYHAYIMAKNLVEGNGFVYNVGTRVSATTCPLFTLIVALGYSFFRNEYLVGTFLGVIFSTVSAGLMIIKLCEDRLRATLSTGILLGCYSFLSFTTAGLENSLLFLLAILFFVVIICKEKYDKKELFYLSLLLSLLAMTRMDSVIIFIPIICYCFLFCTNVKFVQRVFIGLLGLLPFILWEVFSIIYYGYPFPNTMYIKLNTGISKIEYIKHGVHYIIRSSLVDALILIIPLLFIIFSLICKNKKMVAFSIGIIFYYAYIVYIGGDFMNGRHLTVSFFISLLGINELSKQKILVEKQIVNKALIFSILFSLIWNRSLSIEIQNSRYYSLSNKSAETEDEKTYYYMFTGFIPYVCAQISGNDSVYNYDLETEVYIEELRRRNVKGGCLEGLPGIRNYYAQSEGKMYLTDSYGLMDPLLCHLPAIHTDNWRVGHLRRAIPEGYVESIETNTNKIANSSLHEFYDKVLIIVQGDIWSISRLKTIIKMNLGYYDYLVDDYIQSIE